MPATFANFRLQAANHVARANLAIVQRLQIDQHASAVQGGIGSVDSDERGQILDRRILQNDLRQFLLLAGHFGKDIVCDASLTPWMTPVS